MLEALILVATQYLLISKNAVAPLVLYGKGLAGLPRATPGRYRAYYLKIIPN